MQEHKKVIELVKHNYIKIQKDQLMKIDHARKILALTELNFEQIVGSEE